MNKEPAKKIINFLDSNYRLFEVFWKNTHGEDREEITNTLAQIIDEYIEFNYR